MKRYLLFTIVFFLFVTAGLQAQGSVSLQLEQARNDKGVCRVCIFASAAAFNGNGGQPVSCLEVPVKGGRASALFDKIPPGKYAVLVFHDANNNGKMDKNFMGIPKEGYGASRNKLPFAAAPEFEANRFEVKNNTRVHLTIRLRNL